LTGRYERFHTLRQSGGLSGFSNPAESVHDLFQTGHASTSVSSALGLAEARRLRGDPHYSLAILGDGALTGGLVYEAMNNAGHSGARLIVVLNDNEMSISRNVGGLSPYLALLRSLPTYRRAKQRVERALRHIPFIGDALATRISRVKRFFKRLWRNANIFEDLGLEYLGPVDGHDIDQLCKAFHSAKLSQRPVLVHVHTVKGKGYNPAEQAPSAFHGTNGFDIETGEPLATCGSFSRVFGKALCQMARADASICAVTAAMSMGTGLCAFEREFPQRFFDAGIAEAHAVTFAAGLARQGLRPAVALYSTFLQRAYDSLLHDVALQGLPLTVLVDRAGLVGEDGATHHGLYDIALCAGIPGAVVYAVSAAEELRRWLQQSMEAQQGLTILRYARGEGCAMPEGFAPSFGAFDLFGGAQARLAIVTFGRLFFAACEAKRRLAEQGVSLKVLKLNRILPPDPAAVEAVLACEKIHFFEEGVRGGGAGERFGLALLERRFAGTYRLHAIEGFVRHAPAEELLAECGLDASAMTQAFL
jgi:1-deoxy-D-xylulose-5-phosphate synthase